jgi:hypothetical protein
VNLWWHSSGDTVAFHLARFDVTMEPTAARTCLQAFLAAWQLNGADHCAPAVSNALEAVRAAIEHALTQAEPSEFETTRELIQTALDAWAWAYDGPGIEISFG